MDFDLSKPQKLLQESARTFFERECPIERVRKLMETPTASDGKLWQALADQGWLGLTLAEQVGGLDLGCVELAVVAEEMGRACLPGPYLATTWAARLIDASGNDKLMQQYLPGIADGSIKASVALLESESGWEPRHISMQAKRDRDGYRLSGAKHFVLDAQTADLIVCVAQGDDGLLIALLPADRAGLSVTATPGIDRTRKLYRVDCDNVSVGAADVLATGSDAASALERSLQVAAVMACAELVGGMQWVLTTAVEYAKTRKQFDKPIGSFQAVQHQCADMLLFTESARSATYYAAWTLSVDDPDAQRAVSMAKAYCSDAAREVGNRGVQVHGGIGFTWEHDLHLFYRRAKADELLFGDATFHREKIAQLLVDAAD
jgi:alkylation response protein AidB-like acyl-CoA dehydrogenase